MPLHRPDGKYTAHMQILSVKGTRVEYNIRTVRTATGGGQGTTKSGGGQGTTKSGGQRTAKAIY